MYIEILTPETKIYEGEAVLVQFPGTAGSFAVLKSHAPIISTLNEGKIKIVTKEGTETYFQISGGVVEVKNDKIIVLAESA
ncbi:MAG: ATP synthase F1 subunit epsilon [Bacteroidota bacterium]